MCPNRTGVMIVGLGLFVGLGLMCMFGVLLSPMGKRAVPRHIVVNRPLDTVQLAASTAPKLAVTPAEKQCWIFNHLNKAGGSTVKYMMMPWVEQHNVSLGVYDTKQWQSGKTFAHEYLHTDYTLTWGTYPEALRPYGGQDCKWFTIFRHPVPRLVSAYFYCKKSPQDSLCASVVLKAEDTDLLTFAEHWGNFALRQFSLAFVKPEDVIAAEVDDTCKGDRADNRCPGWYRLKIYLETLHAAEQAAGSEHEARAMRDVAMYEFVKPVEAILSEKYAAVGILERWEATLRLFNASLKVPEFDWPKAFRKIGKKNGDSTFRTQEKEALRTAWTDPNVKKFLWLDIILYDHAVSVHLRQVSEHGLA